MNKLTHLFIFLCLSHSIMEINADEEPHKSTKDLVQHLLSQDLGERRFSFPDVVSAATGKSVIPFSKDDTAHATVKIAVEKAAQKILQKLNQPDSPTHKLRRINEASRIFEELFLKELDEHPNISCSVPQNQQGRKQRSGYPDLLITHTASHGENHGKATFFYLDPKLYEKKSRNSSLRTFYYEPKTHTNKILHNAIHLLVGISHDGNDGAWTFTGWEIVDLSAFNVRLKAEFQASNKDLYQPHTIIGSSIKSH